MEKILNQKIKEIADLINSGLTKQEFINAFQTILNYLKKLEQSLNQKVDNKIQLALNNLEKLQEDYQKAINQIAEENQSSFSNMKKWAIEQVNSLFIKMKINDKIKELTNKLDELNDYELPNASDIAVEASKLAQDGLLPLIPIVDKIEEKLPQLGDKIRDSLELLQGNERLDISAIKELRKELDELKRRPVGRIGGGGFSKLAMDLHFIDNEAVGNGDGATTVFTLANLPNPSASLKITVGGGELFLTDDWTISSQTITFLTAPPDGAKIRASYRI